MTNYDIQWQFTCPLSPDPILDGKGHIPLVTIHYSGKVQVRGTGTRARTVRDTAQILIWWTLIGLSVSGSYFYDRCWFGDDPRHVKISGNHEDVYGVKRISHEENREPPATGHPFSLGMANPWPFPPVKVVRPTSCAVGTEIS